MFAAIPSTQDKRSLQIPKR